MVSQTITLTNGSGLHMRPAGVLASAMAPFASDVTIVAAGIKCGTEVEVRCEGADEQAALDAAIQLIESGLGE